VRGLLVVNPNATSTTSRMRTVIENAFAAELELDVVETQYRGHARELARAARAAQSHVVLTLGGDGTVNEVVNGLLADGLGPDVPALATVPGGSANVFVRALGLPTDPIEATGALLSALRSGQTRMIGLGQANDRWFTSNAGLGLDAEIIVDMERQRREGRAATPGRYVRTGLTQFLRHTDRQSPALTLVPSDGDPIPGVFLVIVQNTSPWTFLGPVPFHGNPSATFDTGLDVFAPTSLGILSTTRHVWRLFRGVPPRDARDLVSWHDHGAFRVIADSAAKLQVDGDAVGDVAEVRFAAVPRALRVYV
jgi:diacylglycerol kinase family enzyme